MDRSRAQYEEFRRSDRIEWLRDMLLYAGTGVPDDYELDAVALDANRYVPPGTRATVAGAADALRRLHVRGFALFTASGDDSENLRSYLRGLGVDDLFVETYGADLLGAGKDGPEFYAALLAHAAIHPADAIVVDDDAWPALVEGMPR